MKQLNICTMDTEWTSVYVDGKMYRVPVEIGAYRYTKKKDFTFSAYINPDSIAPVVTYEEEGINNYGLNSQRISHLTKTGLDFKVAMKKFVQFIGKIKTPIFIFSDADIAVIEDSIKLYNTLHPNDKITDIKFNIIDTQAYLGYRMNQDCSLMNSSKLGLGTLMNYYNVSGTVKHIAIDDARQLYNVLCRAVPDIINLRLDSDIRTFNKHIERFDNIRNTLIHVSILDSAERDKLITEFSKLKTWFNLQLSDLKEKNKPLKIIPLSDFFKQINNKTKDETQNDYVDLGNVIKDKTFNSKELTSKDLNGKTFYRCTFINCTTKYMEQLGHFLMLDCHIIESPTSCAKRQMSNFRRDIEYTQPYNQVMVSATMDLSLRREDIKRHLSDMNTCPLYIYLIDNSDIYQGFDIKVENLLNSL